MKKKFGVATACAVALLMGSVALATNYNIFNDQGQTLDITDGYQNQDNTYANIYNKGTLNVNGATFKDNNGVYAGNIYSNGGEVNINNSLFDSNTSSYYAGSIFVAGDSSINIKNSKFINNVMTDYGAPGGLYLNTTTDVASTIADTVFEGNKNTYVSTSPSKVGIGGAIAINDGALILNNVSLLNNSASAGGAIYVLLNTTEHPQLQINNSKIIGNSSNSQGGAISNMGSLNVSGTVFEDNQTTQANNDGGGAIFAGASSSTFIDNSEFKNNQSASFGGAIGTRTEIANNSEAKLDIINSNFSGNKAATNGGAIDNHFYDSVLTDGYVTVDNSLFTNNSADNGGAIYNHGEKDKGNNHAKISISNSTFEGNTSASAGGAFFTKGNYNIDNSTFKDNSTDGDGGAIYSNVSTTYGKNTITNSKFINNKAIGYSVADSGAISLANGIYELKNNQFIGNEAKVGGAIYAYTGNKDGVKVEIDNTIFENNTARSGGAIFTVASQRLLSDGGMTITNSTFKNNSAYESDSDGGGAIFVGAEAIVSIDNSNFDGNTSASAGGVIATRDYLQGNNSAAKLDIVNSNFSNNSAATNGGAIDNYLYNSVANNGYVTVDNSTFTNNSAQNGGAIYNHGEEDRGGNKAKIAIKNSTFDGNKANLGAGGAVYTANDTIIENSTFTNNESNGTAYKKQGVGGAVAVNGGNVTIENSTFEGNKALAGSDNQWSLGGAVSTMNTVVSNLNIVKSKFKNNIAGIGGAIYNMLKSGNTINVSDSEIANNTAISGGGLANFSNMNIDNTVIKDNVANTTETDGGGAIFMGSESKTTVSNSIISNNTSTGNGGGIYTRNKDGGAGTNAGASLDVAGTTFDSNSTEMNGGAIFNSFYESQSKSGAVSISDSTFTNNKAQGLGGAIYNNAAGEADRTSNAGTLYITNSAFTGNTDSTGKNDIHNNGTLILGESNAFDGGINGSGKTILSSNSYTYLDNASIIQNTIDIETNAEISANNKSNDGYLILASDTLNMNGDAYLGIDWGDTIDVATVNGSGKFTLNDLNINSDLITDGASTKLFDNATVTVDTSNIAIVGNDKKYEVIQDSTNSQNIKIKDTGSTSQGLSDAVTDTSNTTIFVVGGDYSKDSESSLGELNTGDLNIKGDNDKVNTISGVQQPTGENPEGIKITNNDSTLTINNIDTIQGYKSSENGGFIDSVGTINLIGKSAEKLLELKNMVAKKFGGVVANKSNHTIISHHTAFTSNSVEVGGGAVANIASASTNTFAQGADNDAVGIDSNGVFSYNIATGNDTNEGLGGAIFNYADDGFSADYTFDSTTFRGNTAGTLNSDGSVKYTGKGGAIYNWQNSATTSTANIYMDNATFEDNIAYGDGGAIWNNCHIYDLTGSTAPSNIVFRNNTALDGKGGAIYNDDKGTIGATTGVIALNNSLFEGNTAKDGSAIYNENLTTAIELTDTNVINNTATNEGTIYTKGDTVSIVAKNNNVLFTGNKATTVDGILFDTTSDVKLNLDAADDKNVIMNNNIATNGAGTTTVNINTTTGSTGTVTLGENFKSLDRTTNTSMTTDYNVGGGTLKIANESNFTGNGSNNLTMADGSALNTQNGTTSTIELASLNLNGGTIDWSLDVSSSGSDAIKSAIIASGGTINVKNIDTSALNNGRTSFDLAQGGDTTGLNFTLDSSLNGVVLQDKIYRRGLALNGSTLTLAPVAGERDYRSFNPAVLASPVAAQVGSYLTQLNIYEQAFGNMDMLMAMTKKQRTAMKFANKYADATQGTGAGGVITFDPNQLPEQNKGLWFRPFTTFERVGLNNGPTVENIAYGSLVGGDSSIIELSKGWDMIYSLYAGYTGSHQTYDGVGIYQNGGTLGASSVWYKNDFFTGLTVNVGANAGQADTMYGSEDFTMLTAGIASKTGYNFELANGKFIIQPNYLMSYTFVNTFDYTNAAGVDITSDPLHAIQIAPGIKFIGNLENGWQPYASVQMVWNIIDQTHFWANDVSLPNMSIKPYIQYGVGLQKRWGDRFTAFGQAMIRNGGRSGLSLQFGLRWMLGE